jgi:hypothetical protein
LAGDAVTWDLMGLVLVGIGMAGCLVNMWARFTLNRRLIKHSCLAVAVAYACAGLADVLGLDAKLAAFNFGIAALWGWQWWREGGDDDFRKGRKRLASKVREVAGRLTVVPAPAGAS